MDPNDPEVQEFFYKPSPEEGIERQETVLQPAEIINEDIPRQDTDLHIIAKKKSSLKDIQRTHSQQDLKEEEYIEKMKETYHSAKEYLRAT